MATTLLQKLKDALNDGELNGDVKGNVLVEMLKIIADNRCCSVGLGLDDKLDAADRALKLFLAELKSIAEKTDTMDALHRMLEVLCINACQIERRKTIHGVPMGVRMGDNFPDTWEI